VDSVKKKTMIAVRQVTRRYRQGENVVAALDRVDLEIDRFDVVAVTGESGSGKSTLLHLLGGLDRPDEGEIVVDSLALCSASERDLTEYRRTKLGIIFQFFNLLPTLNVLENVCLPLELQGMPQKSAKTRAKEMLELVGMQHRARHFVHQLSGGEMQRTAIARALVHRPKLVLADEPTGNLDAQNAGQVLAVFEQIARERLTTLVLVTHSLEVASVARRTLRLNNGRVEADSAMAPG
jgi:putative ABC transport system ATP-binding protein